MKMLVSAVLALAAFAFVPAARGDDPSLHEVYQAVHEGRLTEAQAMMTRVLHDHPDSAKAHYVEAEVLVRLGRAGDANAELERAEHLAPGLPFAKAEAVRDLRGLITERERGRMLGAERGAGAVVDARPSEQGFPWGVLLIVAGAGFLLFLFLRSRRAPIVPMTGAGVGSAGAPYGASPYGAAPMSAPGIGSGIIGGLATGAAVGAGMVAGEALAHEFLGNHDRDRSASDAALGDRSRVANDDGGGRDFGVSDSDSWDAGGSGNDIAGDGGGGGDWG
ncbi:TPR repeat-containing protein [Burkholderiales bacterium]|nr:TPR repeat-containing protein [Burkholderiales bacterium]